MHFIDVGQGDSILAESDGHYMLIDAGENDQAGTVISYLKAQGVTKLDYVIGTHPHSDHIGGLDKVIDTLDVYKRQGQGIRKGFPSNRQVPCGPPVRGAAH